MADFKKSTIVQDSLTLWSSSRFIERTWRLFGENTLGLSPVHDPLNPWNGIIPVTPIMDQQLDQIVIHTILVPLQNGLLRGLEKKVYGRKREDWFEIYLTIFILMSNTEWQLAHERQFAQRYGMSVCNGRPKAY